MTTGRTPRPCAATSNRSNVLRSTQEVKGVPTVGVALFGGGGDGNATPYGLGASVWSADIERALQVGPSHIGCAVH